MLNVFIVDDENLIREGIKKLLPWEALGFSICGEAANGRDALPLIHEKQPDIVITDLKMPLVDGIALANHLSTETPRITVIVITGFDEFEYAKAAVRAGVFDFLLKPVSPDELRDTLLRAAEKIRCQEYSYPFELENALITAVQKGENAECFSVLDRIFDDFTRYHVDMYPASRICRKLINELDIYYRKYSGSEASVLKPKITNDMTFAELKTIAEDYLSRILSTETFSSSDILVEKIKLYLESHYQENITLKVLENEFFFNSSYISRIFKLKTGENYNDYLLKIRIEHAKDLLSTTNRSIIHISEMTGFGSSKYFSRIFKTVTGMSPITFRATYHDSSES